MLNILLKKNHEIVILAPGSLNENKITNDLIWDINFYLNSHLNLYNFYVGKEDPLAIYNLRIHGFFKKNVVFNKMDNMFINRTNISDDVLEKYRKIIDPKYKINNDVFKELCCIENVDMEYIAVENDKDLLNHGVNLDSFSSFKRWITSSFPVYLSLYSFKEMRIIVNDKYHKKNIQEIVYKYCSNVR